MANIFGETRVGCFVKFNVKVNQSGGAVITFPDKTVLPGSGQGLPFVIVDVVTETSELMALQRCFESRVFSYLYGSDVEAVTVRMLMFLTGGKEQGGLSANKGKVLSKAGTASSASGAFKYISDLYEANRISVSRKMCSITFNGAKNVLTRLALVGMDRQVQNVEQNLYNVTLKFIRLPKPSAAGSTK